MEQFYGELAHWWPLISPVSDYAETAQVARDCLKEGQREIKEVLELGAGGGHNAFYLKKHYAMTLNDLSPHMLQLSQKLNPECEHGQGDMRSLRLQRTFDAVFVFDAIDYMCSTADLQALFETLYLHCRPNGVVLLMPDHTQEDYVSYTDYCGTEAEDGSGARCFEWCWDPDPTDNTVVTDYVFLLRQPSGETNTVKERHTTGLFKRKHWLTLLEQAGFKAEFKAVKSLEMEHRYPCFIGHKL